MVRGQLDGKRLLMGRDKSVWKESRSLGDIHAKGAVNVRDENEVGDCG